MSINILFTRCARRVVGEERILEFVPVEGAVSSQVLVMTADVTSSDLSIKVVQVHDEQHLHIMLLV